jgi:predicted amidohydrolase
MRLLLTQPRLTAYDNEASRAAVLSALDTVVGGAHAEDVLVLPEHAFFFNDSDAYLAELIQLATTVGCTVVGGSIHERNDSVQRNTGAVVTAGGDILCCYDKLRPYSEERARVDAGTRLGECTINGHRALILICADFWFSDLFMRVRELPELLLVPALSVTRKPDASYSRRLWRHLAISRAYEFGVYVGISDWAADSELPRLRASGVGGYADSATTDADRFFRPTGDARIQVVNVDFDALAAFRRDREDRGFFWKASGQQQHGANDASQNA